MKPLVNVASGGELSRIMLAIKTVMADRDDIETLIFDEIDVGISGRTAHVLMEETDQRTKQVYGQWNITMWRIRDLRA